MYCIYGESGSSLHIESTDSVIILYIVIIELYFVHTSTSTPAHTGVDLDPCQGTVLATVHTTSSQSPYSIFSHNCRLGRETFYIMINL